MKNVTTPRTLAECEFTTGYPLAQSERRARWGGLLAGAVTLVAFASVGVLLAWRG